MPNRESTIYLAEVTNTTDPSQSLTFKAIIAGEGNQEKEIYLTDVGGGAPNSRAQMTPYPELGAKILVCRSGGYWFYMASVPGMPAGPTVDEERNTEEATEAPGINRSGEDVGETLPSPPRQSRVVSDGKGNSLSFFRQVNNLFNRNSVKLKSAGNKVLELDDSTGVDSIILKNEHNDFFILTSVPAETLTLPPRAAVLQTFGAQRFINRESETDILVYDGKELNLLNNSTGANGPGGEGPDADNWGNINLQSRYRDINIFTGGDGDETGSDKPQSARIFIECLNKEGDNQLIQIDTRGDGTVRIIAPKVEVSAGVEGLDIISGGNINMVAAGSINMKSNSTNIRTDGNINADGNQIWLNSDKAAEAGPVIEQSESFYGEEGNAKYSEPINSFLDLDVGLEEEDPDAGPSLSDLGPV